MVSHRIAELRHLPLQRNLAKSLGARVLQFPTPRGQSKRTNVVSPSLCDDALRRLAPSLSAYQGCDIIDLNPGACLWSSKLQQALKPRAHVLVENDVEFYKPYLEQTVQSAPSVFTHVKMQVTDARHWANLFTAIGPTLESLNAPAKDSGINKSLLLVANLSSGAQVRGFRVSALIFLRKFLRAMVERSDIHHKGPVRLLAWMHTDETRGVSPRTVSSYSKLACLVNQTTVPSFIVSQNRAHMVDWMYRRHWPIDLESEKRVASIIAEEDIYDPPERRQPRLGPHYSVFDNTFEGREAMMELPMIASSVREFIKLENSPSPLPPVERRKLTMLRGRYRMRRMQHQLVDAMVADRLALDDEERQLAETNADADAWSALEQKIWSWRSDPTFDNPTVKAKILKDVDDWRAFRSERQVLAWDCRKADPLLPTADEFFPEEPLTLVDLEPYPAGLELIEKPDVLTCLEYISNFWGRNLLRSAQDFLEDFVPGAASHLASKVPALTDVSLGGSRFLNDVRVRTIPPVTLAELAVAFQNSPFRPSIERMASSSLPFRRMATRYFLTHNKQ